MAEHFALFAVARLRGESRRYAERLRARHPDVAPWMLAERVRAQAALIARVDGAVSGTPFLMALVPAYVAVLWEQARMVLRIAALMGHNLDAPELPAELLALRGVYPSTAEAAAALKSLPKEPHRRLAGGLHNLIEVGRRFLILAGFLGPKPDVRPSRIHRALMLVAGAGLWVGTWIFPTAFMVVMSYSCESSTRTLGTRALDHYGVSTPAERKAEARQALSDRRRRVISSILLGISLLVPLAIVALGVDERVRYLTWQRAAVAITGIAVVLALFAASTRRRLR
jgi:hypothetical protein